MRRELLPCTNIRCANQECQPGTLEALLDLLLANQVNLLCNIFLSDSLGCHHHHVVGLWDTDEHAEA